MKSILETFGGYYAKILKDDTITSFREIEVKFRDEEKATVFIDTMSKHSYAKEKPSNALYDKMYVVSVRASPKEIKVLMKWLISPAGTKLKEIRKHIWWERRFRSGY